jgi:hypothetical protein
MCKLVSKYHHNTLITIPSFQTIICAAKKRQGELLKTSVCDSIENLIPVCWTDPREKILQTL